MGAVILGALTLSLAVYGLLLKVPALAPRALMIRRLDPAPVLPAYHPVSTRLAERLRKVPATRRLTPAQFRAIQLGLAGAAAAAFLLPALLMGSPPDWAAVAGYPLLMAVAPAVWLHLQLARRRVLLQRSYPDMLAHLAIQTRAGAGTMQAFASMPPVLQEPLRGEVQELIADMGVAPFPAALARFARRCASAEIDSFARHVTYQQSLGIALPEVLAAEEAHALSMARQAARQRIQATAVVLAAVTVILLINGLAIYLMPAGFDLTRMITQ